MTGKNKSRIETHYVVIDTFSIELGKRIKAYDGLVKHFLFITRLHSEATIDVNESVDNFIMTYKCDVDHSIKNEFIQFKHLWKQSKPEFYGCDVHKMFEWMTNNDSKSVFPNIYIAIRIYLTIPVANCTAERAFSKLGRVQNKNRSSLLQDNLSSLIILSKKVRK